MDCWSTELEFFSMKISISYGKWDCRIGSNSTDRRPRKPFSNGWKVKIGQNQQTCVSYTPFWSPFYSCKSRVYQEESGTYRSVTKYRSFSSIFGDGYYTRVPLEIWCEIDKQETFQTMNLIECTTLHYNRKKPIVCSMMRKSY